MLYCRNRLMAFLLMFMTWAGTAFSADFRDVKAFGDGFVAVSGNGDIVFTDANGNSLKTIHVDRLKANAVAVHGNVVYAAGKDGRMVSVTDGKVRQIENSGPDINAMTIMGNRLFAACGQGKVLVMDLPGGKPRPVETGTGQNLIDISAAAGVCYALTAQGLIMSSTDGRSWKRFDFNQNYADFYDSTTFTCICASDNSVYAAGVAENGYPRVYTSVKGMVWSQRGLSFTQDGLHQELDAMPLGMCYDAQADRYIMCCTDGVVFFMPGCTHCNSIEYRLAGDLESVAINGRSVIAAGEGDYLE